MFLNTGSGSIDIFEVNLTFDMLTVRRQQHSFLTHEWVFLWKCQSFWDRKYLDLRGTRTPNLRIHAECFNLLTYQGQTFDWLWRYRYFWIKLTFEMLKLCAGNSIYFSTHERCSWQSAKVFETEHIWTWGGLEPPTFGFMPNALALSLYIYHCWKRPNLNHLYDHSLMNVINSH